MHEILKDKSVVFFDAGYTLIYPASGSWLFTNKFNEVAGDRMQQHSDDSIRRAVASGSKYYVEHHKMGSEDEEKKVFTRYFGIISEELNLGLTNDEITEIADDHTYNVGNYVLYPDTVNVLSELSKTYTLGIISDTSPSLENKLKELGIRKFFSFATYSFDLGVFKPDRRMYIDALQKCGRNACETVFIDDLQSNLDGAAEFGITPILIAANPASDIETPYTKIHSLSELI